MKLMKTTEAVGQVLCHDITQIIPGVEKGHQLSLRQCCRGRKAQLINFIIDRRIFRNISVRLRHIRFRLIIIIVGNKILDGILREKFFHFSVQLPRQCFVARTINS